MADKEAAKMNKRFVRNYLTLDEVFPDFELATVQGLVNSYTASAETLDTWFGDVLDILKDEFGDWYIGFVDKAAACPIWETEDIDEDEELELKKKFLKKLMFTYRFTKDRYIYLLNLYESQESNLMAQLGTTVSVTADHRVNDTPQNGGA